MIEFILVYLLGYFVSIALCYLNNKLEFEKTDLDEAMFLSLFSWLTAVMLLYNTAHDTEWFRQLNKKFKGE